MPNSRIIDELGVDPKRHSMNFAKNDDRPTCPPPVEVVMEQRSPKHTRQLVAAAKPGANHRIEGRVMFGRRRFASDYVS